MNFSSPLIFRKENFGGIVFSGHDGSLLELDEQAFALLLRAAQEGEHPDRGFASGFLRTQMSLLGGFPSEHFARPMKVFAHPSVNEFPFQVFSAPTLADFQITTRCDEGCPHCYVAAQPHGEDVSLNDALLALDSFAQAGVCQVALGGGEPLLHPQLESILEGVRERGMIPNLTTTGRHLNSRNTATIRACCGAAALSLEAVGERYALRRRRGFSSLLEAMNKLSSAQIPTVLQVTVGAGNLEDIPSIVDFALTRDLYGIIFLAYKPVGRGQSFDAPLTDAPANKSLETLSAAFRRLASHTRVGYDCCMGPLVAGFPDAVYGPANALLEGCSALRGSVGVSHRLEILPCTFLSSQSLGSLKKSSLLDIWHGAEAQAFRRGMEHHARNSPYCSGCSLLHQCAGGCSQMNLVPCGRRQTGKTQKDL